MTTLITLACKEFEDRLRNGWILAIALAFSGFAFVIGAAGFGFAGRLGSTDSQATIISLTSLVLYLIPLLGLLLGYDGIVGEQKQGTLELLLSYPVTAKELLFGKWLGLSAALAVVLLIGLMLPAVLAVVNGHGLLPWLVFYALSIWLGTIFISIALLLSTFGREPGTALGLAVAVWILLVILFDVGLIGLLVATGGNVPPWVVNGIFYLNPASIFRLLNLVLQLDEQTLAGMGFLSQGLPIWSLIASLGAWGIAPLLFAVRRVIGVG